MQFILTALKTNSLASFMQSQQDFRVRQLTVVEKRNYKKDDSKRQQISISCFWQVMKYCTKIRIMKQRNQKVLQRSEHSLQGSCGLKKALKKVMIKEKVFS